MKCARRRTAKPAASQLVAELAARVAPAVVGDLVHLVEQERVRRHGQHQHPARLEHSSRWPQRPDVVVDVLEHVEQARAGRSRRPSGGKRPSSTSTQRRRRRAARTSAQALRVHVAGARERHPALAQEREQAAAAAADVEERAAREVGNGVAQHVAHHLAPRREPEVLALDRAQRREVVRVEARRAHAARRAGRGSPSSHRVSRRRTRAHAAPAGGRATSAPRHRGQTSRSAASRVAQRRLRRAPAANRASAATRATAALTADARAQARRLVAQHHLVPPRRDGDRPVLAVGAEHGRRHAVDARLPAAGVAGAHHEVGARVRLDVVALLARGERRAPGAALRARGRRARRPGPRRPALERHLAPRVEALAIRDGERLLAARAPRRPAGERRARPGVEAVDVDRDARAGPAATRPRGTRSACGSGSRLSTRVTPALRSHGSSSPTRAAARRARARARARAATNAVRSRRLRRLDAVEHVARRGRASAGAGRGRRA